MAHERRQGRAHGSLRGWLALAAVMIGCQALSGLDELEVTAGAGAGVAGGSSGSSAQPEAGNSGQAEAGAGVGGEPGGCTPGSCPDGQMCRDGGCIEPMQDADMDGVVAGSDCDDDDPLVGITAERDCASACASGIERCVMGTWDVCDAPVECSCSSGETRSVSCGACGMRAQECDAKGSWQYSGECLGEGECSPGAKEDRGKCGKCGNLTRTCLESCAWDSDVCADEGVCGTGETEEQPEGCGACGDERKRTRACTDTCGWGSWGNWGSCSTTAGCVPNAGDDESTACGNCESGTKDRARKCGGDCSWGSWGAWGSCLGETGCIAGTTQSENGACGNCSLGTRSRVRQCTAACGWASWGAWGSCVGGGECSAGQTESSSQSCGNCPTGSKQRSRTCSGSCGWGTWGTWGACSGLNCTQNCCEGTTCQSLSCN